MCPNPQETADLVTLTEEILNKELYFLCSERERERERELTASCAMCPHNMKTTTKFPQTWYCNSFDKKLFVV